MLSQAPKQPSQKSKQPSQNSKQPSQKSKQPSQKSKQPSQNSKQPSQNSKQPSQNSKPPSQTPPSQPQIVINIDESAKTYFNSRVPDEENPVLLGVSTNIRYYNLEILFDTFYPIDSISRAKDTSKKERLIKKLKDPSFTYGEIVYILFY